MQLHTDLVLLDLSYQSLLKKGSNRRLALPPSHNSYYSDVMVLSQFTNVIELDPNDANAHVALGKILTVQSKRSEE